MTSNTETRSILRGIAMALLAFAIFSLHDALIKSVQDVAVFQIVFFVVLFSFVPLSFTLAVDKRERSLRPNNPLLILLHSAFGVISLLCAFYAFTNLPLSEAYALIFSAPIIITLLAIPILGEKIRLIRWIAIALGMAGVIMVLRPTQTDLTIGHFAGITAAFCIACNSIVTRKIGTTEHPTTLVLFPMLSNFIVSGIATLFLYEPMAGATLFKLATVGILSVTAQMIMVTAYRNTEAQFIAPMQYSQMLWAIFYSVLVFDEKIDTPVILGATIIIFSGLLFIWRELTTSVIKPILRARTLRSTSGPII